MKKTIRVLMIQAHRDAAREEGYGVSPPIGFLSLAAYARQALPDLELRFRLVDSFFHSDETVRREMTMFSPDVVAISGITPAHRRMERLCAMAHRELPGVRVILGGPHPTSYPDLCLRYPGVHALVRGEGEIAFADYLEYVAGLRPLEQVRRLYYNRDGLAVQNPESPLIENLDDLPFPAVDLVDLSRYFSVTNDLNVMRPPPHRYWNIYSSRGCRYRCIFCHHLFGRQVRTMSVARLIEYVKIIVHEYGVRDIRFMDDLFNVSRRRVLDFCNALVREGVRARIHFCTGLRADILDEEQIRAMADAGVVYLGIAVESGSPRQQIAMKKYLNLNKVLEMASLSDRAGIFTTGFFMFGFPGETREEMELTIRVAEASAFHYAYFSVLQPYGGSEVSQVNPSVFDTMADFEGGLSGLRRNLAGIPEAEMRSVVQTAFRRFWTPRRILAFLARHPDLGEFGRGLVVPRTVAQMLKRTVGVLGLPVPVPARTTNWSPPYLPPDSVQHLAMAFGRTVARAAKAMHRPKMPPDLSLLQPVSRNHVAHPRGPAQEERGPAMGQSEGRGAVPL